jgi:DNA N-6-adenine-methyltransferase (Dam)
VLGPFDLDPAAADPRPWDCAAVNYTERDDGLRQPWFGRVWLNPPSARYVAPFWIRTLARHGCGTALLHARTETDWFEPIWESAAAILFMADRLAFHRPDGTHQPANSGAPPILVAFGHDDAERLKVSSIPGSQQLDVAEATPRQPDTPYRAIVPDPFPSPRGRPPRRSAARVTAIAAYEDQHEYEFTSASA